MESKTRDSIQLSLHLIFELMEALSSARCFNMLIHSKSDVCTTGDQDQDCSEPEAVRKCSRKPRIHSVTGDRWQATTFFEIPRRPLVAGGLREPVTILQTGLGPLAGDWDSAVNVPASPSKAATNGWALPCRDEPSRDVERCGVWRCKSVAGRNLWRSWRQSDSLRLL